MSKKRRIRENLFHSVSINLYNFQTRKDDDNEEKKIFSRKINESANLVENLSGKVRKENFLLFLLNNQNTVIV
jgi:hypothetical protein